MLVKSIKVKMAEASSRSKGTWHGGTEVCELRSLGLVASAFAR